MREIVRERACERLLGPNPNLARLNQVLATALVSDRHRGRHAVLDSHSDMMESQLQVLLPGGVPRELSEHLNGIRHTAQVRLWPALALGTVTHTHTGTSTPDHL